ncbi:MAG: bifunctional transcriptional activator/DNA repair enzyme AdaA [Bacteroidota bacterium]|nr:methylated-DNA--[protein]-cysteine S-methyltransferase [Ignavibacteria bacterium]MCU7499714.1 methylated-DNA--[protein]-cysteine S-methyltransferase [Ignavibacteria bacterium]MCU7514124.1 methylated-DNA--[protein]-cysteine S-methyltransferase [Ignavibacteria bacterium]MCU7519891.1 methylated-DNA--[protein]-cysteine S-methyltransferase [Ignavibacteria bacterium]MCU7526030.1 methylated-DNA--[protein]-cysteine S-methyltransferase [Ignavibacteria bacterium]
MNDLTLDNEVMYQALLDKDSRYEGIFFVGVKTTGIFCRPTCTARKPKKENTEFFSTCKEALTNGYRPCRICHPMEQKGDVPDYIRKFLKELELNPHVRISDSFIRERLIDPNKLRRWFKKNHGITFQSYQRLLRINRAIGNIKFGDNVAEAAMENGYDSLSGFQEALKKAANITPKESQHKTVVTMTRIATKLGPMIAGATEEGICLLEFADRRMIETELKYLERILNAVTLPGESTYFKELKKELDEYFEGVRRTFDLPLVLSGSDFQKKAWKALLEIPYGETRSYKQQAMKIGFEKAVRAAGRANGENRIAIIIPCHRVIGENGNLTGYGGGIWRKQWLLKHEKENK